MRTIILLFCSNIFMTIAWYWHLKFSDMALWKVILISWLIAFLEYSIMVPANRYGYISSNYSAGQLKVVNEAITLVVFGIFSVLYLKEKITLNYVAAFLCILLAVYFIFKKPI